MPDYPAMKVWCARGGFVIFWMLLPKNYGYPLHTKPRRVACIDQAGNSWEWRLVRRSAGAVFMYDGLPSSG